MIFMEGLIDNIHMRVAVVLDFASWEKATHWKPYGAYLGENRERSCQSLRFKSVLPIGQYNYLTLK